jgi:hypothetical protein
MTFLTTRPTRRLARWITLAALLLIALPITAQEEDDPLEDAAPWEQQTGGTFTLSAPRDWIDVQDQAALDDAMSMLAESNPEMGAIFEQAQAQGAANFDQYLLEAGTGSSLNVNVIDLGGQQISMGEIELALVQTYAQTGIDVVDSEIVTLPAGEALRFQVTAEFNLTASESFGTEQYQFVFNEGSSLIVVTVGGLEEFFEDLSPVYLQIANTLEFLEPTETSWPRFNGETISVRAPFEWETGMLMGGGATELALSDGTAQLLVQVEDAQAEEDDLLAAASVLEGGFEGAVDDSGFVALPFGPVATLTGEGEIDGDAAQITQYAAYTEEGLVIFTFTVPADAADDYEDLIPQMMDTVRFTEAS